MGTSKKKRCVAGEHGFATVGYQPGPRDCRCPHCSQDPRFRNSSLQGFWFNPDKKGGDGCCPKPGCSFKPKANTEMFGGIPAPKDSPAPSVRAPTGEKAKADRDKVKELEKKVKDLKAEKKGAAAGGSRAAVPATDADQPAASAAGKEELAK